MSEETEKQDNKQVVRLVVLVGGALIILCGVCVAAGVLVRQNLVPQGSLTRTALVELFGTPVAGLSPTPASAIVPTSSPIQLPSPGVEPSITPTKPPPTPTFAPPVWVDPPQGVIAFTCPQDGTNQICVMNADGTQRKQITSGEADSFYPG